MNISSPSKSLSIESDIYSTPIIQKHKALNNIITTTYNINDTNSTNDTLSVESNLNTPRFHMVVDPFTLEEDQGQGHDEYYENNNENRFVPTDHQISNFLLPTIKQKNKMVLSDRFFPNRRMSTAVIGNSSILGNTLQYEDIKNEQNPNNTHTLAQLFEKTILNPIENISSNTFHNRNMFRYQEYLRTITHIDHSYSSIMIPHSENLLLEDSKATRKISKTPYKVLDAPALQDDFYLNLLDWSHQNILAVGLASTVYLWSANTSKVFKLCDLGYADSVASVAWSPKNVMLSVGTSSGDLHIWDSNKMKKIRTLTGHTGRVGSCSWNSSILATGSRDKSIIFRDLRAHGNFFSKLIGHKQEVCGLKWSFDEQQLGSGGNDNKLYIWNTHSTNPILKFTNHTAAVKALAWSPHQHGLLASGGGTADRTIRFWNTLKGQQINCIDTGSQVCALIFSKSYNELVSTHGYSQNQIMLWKYPSLDKITELTGHTYRVLYLAMSPDGQTIVTGAGDETLRFWQVFPKDKQRDDNICKQKLSLSNFELRQKSPI